MASRFSVEAIFSAIDRMSAPVKKMSLSTKALSTGIKRDFAAAQRQAENMGRSISGAGKKIFKYGLAAGGLATGLIVREFINFDQAITSASSKFGDLNLATAEGQKILADLGSTARNVGAGTQFTATQAAQGLEFLAMAGFSAKQSMALLPGVVDLATASNIELSRATDIASDAIGAFGMMSSDTAKLTENFTRINDVMAKTVTSTNTTLEDLFEAAKMGAPVFTSAGQDIETFSAIAGRMAANGIKASNAGTALRMGLLRLSKPPAEAAKALQSMNIRTADSRGNMRNMIDILADVSKGTAKMGNQQKLATIGMIFGARAASAYASIINEGVDQTQALEKVLRDSGGAAAKMAEIVRGSLLNKLKMLWSATVEIGFKFIDAFAKQGGNAIDSITKAVSEFNPQPIIDVFKSVYKFLRFIKPLIPYLLALIAAWMIYKKVMLIVAAVQMIVALTNPVTLIIIGVIALIAIVMLLIKNWDKVKSVFISAGKAIINLLKETGKFIMRLLLAPVNMVIDAIIGLLKLASKIPGVGKKFSAAVEWATEMQNKMNSPFEATKPEVTTQREAITKTIENKNNTSRVVIENQSNNNVRNGSRPIKTGTSLNLATSG